MCVERVVQFLGENIFMRVDRHLLPGIIRTGIISTVLVTVCTHAAP